jgi:hypothetical protein
VPISKFERAVGVHARRNSDDTRRRVQGEERAGNLILDALSTKCEALFITRQHKSRCLFLK